MFKSKYACSFIMNKTNRILSKTAFPSFIIIRMNVDCCTKKVGSYLLLFLINCLIYFIISVKTYVPKAKSFLGNHYNFNSFGKYKDLITHWSTKFLENTAQLYWAICLIVVCIVS